MPLNRNKVDSFKRERANELRKLATVLESLSSSHNAIVRDTGSLQTAANQCASGHDDKWSYSMALLEFITVPDDTHHRVRPRDTRIDSIYLSVELGGVCRDFEDYDDPFTKLEVGIYVEGRKSNQKLSCAWHLDRHITGETVSNAPRKAKPKKKEEEQGEPLCAHPIYHFQHGGRKMWELEEQEYGSQLLLEAPRIAHPPLDAVLAVDFVLSNYYGTTWMKLLEDTQYQQIIAGAQERCWRAYSIATASIWQRAVIDQGKSWPGQVIWPQISVNHRPKSDLINR